jgi:putative ABC transport system permease protein
MFPAAFRRRFGGEILLQVQRDRLRARRAGRAAAAWCGAASVVDLCRAGLGERWHPTWHEPPVFRPLRERPDMRDAIEQWGRDFRYAMRSLRRTPGFAAVTVATLALAIGANAAIFSVVDAVLIRPLPYAHADRLLFVAATAPGSDLPREFGLFDEGFVHYRERSRLIQDLALYNSVTNSLRVGDRVERVRMSSPTYTLFSTLGAAPVLGRLPVADDDRVAVISYTLWQTWFAGDPGVIGRAYQMAGEPRTIIGVMGPRFHFPTDATLLWLPVNIRPGDVRAEVGGNAPPAIARMKPGASPDDVARELTALSAGMPQRFGGSAAYARLIERMRIVARPLSDEMLGPSARPLGVLFGAAAIVLLIACANIANLLIVRGEGRRREMAVRQAIGARRGQLLRVQLAEVLLLAAAAAVAAVGLARLALPLFLRLAPADVPRLANSRVDSTTLLFTGALTLAAAIACGLGPALRGAAPSALRLGDGSRGNTGGRRWARDILVATQTALALVLLIGAGLLLRSHSRLSHVAPGYSTKDLFTFQIAPEQSTLVDGPSFARFSLDFMDRLRALPGVESVGLIENVPLDEGTATGRVRAEGMTTEGVRLGITYAGADYYKTMGINVLAGRAFTRDDAISTLGNAVVSRSAARQLWPAGSALGRKLQVEGLTTWETVVGVVDDVMQENFREPAQALVYLPMRGQLPRQWALSSPAYVVKTARAETIAPDIRAVVHEVAPEAPMYRDYTMSFLAARSMRDLSFTTLTLGMVSLLALILGLVGLYGALSYIVAERTREIGVRMALGAQPERVRRMIVIQGGQVVIAGVAVGLIAAFFSTHALGRLLYGVETLDLSTFAGMSAGMVLTGLIASYLPARRASSVDPIVSLRAE